MEPKTKQEKMTDAQYKNSRYGFFDVSFPAPNGKV